MNMFKNFFMIILFQNKSTQCSAEKKKNIKNKSYLFCGICKPFHILYSYIIIKSLQFSYIKDLFSIQIPSQSSRIHIASESSIASNTSTCGNALIKGWCSMKLSTRSSPLSRSKKSF